MTWVGLQMLRNDRAKFAAMIVAVSLAVFLMQNQAAILATMLSMTAAQIRDVKDADLWVTQPEVECFDQVRSLRDIELLRVRGVPGVAWAAPLVKIDAIGRSDGGRLNTVTVLGIDDATVPSRPFHPHPRPPHPHRRGFRCGRPVHGPAVAAHLPFDGRRAQPRRSAPHELHPRQGDTGKPARGGLPAH